MSRHINVKARSKETFVTMETDDLSIDLTVSTCFYPSNRLSIGSKFACQCRNTLWDQRISVNVNLPVSHIENQRIKRLRRRE